MLLHFPSIKLPESSTLSRGMLDPVESDTLICANLASVGTVKCHLISDVVSSAAESLYRSGRHS